MSLYEDQTIAKLLTCVEIGLGVKAETQQKLKSPWFRKKVAFEASIQPA